MIHSGSVLAEADRHDENDPPLRVHLAFLFALSCLRCLLPVFLPFPVGAGTAAGAAGAGAGGADTGAAACASAGGTAGIAAVAGADL